MSLAFVFPGQGAQVIGMGRDLAAAYPAAQAVFDEVDEALGEKLSVDEANQLIKDLDINKDGKITNEEFMNTMAQG